MANVECVEGHGGSRRRLRLRSPVDGEAIGEIEVSTREDVASALERARKAQRDWAAQPVEVRARTLERLLRLLVARQDRIVETVVRETGKPRCEAVAMEVLASCDAVAYYAKRAPRILRTRRKRIHGLLGLTKQLRIVYRPLGVVGVITPWNGPFILALNPTVQALVAGNAVLLKPSEVTPFSGSLVGELCHEAGFPDGLVTVLLGDGETGAALVECGVDKLSFTGSVATGRRVAQACARQLLPCTLELGGKDPMIVCADADLDRAAAGALLGGFFNAGQYCCGTERIYAVDAIYEEFVGKVVKRASELRQGAEGEFDVGPLFWDRQLQIVESHVEDARARGARVLVGGRRNPDLPGLFYEPTVLVDVTHEMRIMREETFGPVLPIMRVRDEVEALELANDTCYGLGANVWTRDKHKGVELAQRIAAGGVCVNDMAITYGAPEAPFGGRKQSGIGQVNGEVGLRGYCHALPVIVDRFGGKRVQGGYPYRLRDAEGMQRLIRLLWGGPLRRWLS